VQDLERDVTLALEVLGEVDSGHSPSAELALDHMAVAQGVSQLGSRPVDRAEIWGLEGHFESAPVSPS
jgi:hypothetical protein